MKAKLFYVILTVFLSMIGFSANADVLIDPSLCSVTAEGDLPNGGYIKAVTCEGEPIYWVAILMTWDKSYACHASGGSADYLVVGTCEQYSIYRKT